MAERKEKMQEIRLNINATSEDIEKLTSFITLLFPKHTEPQEENKIMLTYDQLFNKTDVIIDYHKQVFFKENKTVLFHSLYEQITKLTELKDELTTLFSSCKKTCKEKDLTNYYKIEKLLNEIPTHIDSIKDISTLDTFKNIQEQLTKDINLTIEYIHTLKYLLLKTVCTHLTKLIENNVLDENVLKTIPPAYAENGESNWYIDFWAHCKSIYFKPESGVSMSIKNQPQVVEHFLTELTKLYKQTLD